MTDTATGTKPDILGIEISRRRFLTGWMAMTGSLLAAPLLMQLLMARTASAAGPLPTKGRKQPDVGYGPIGPKPDLRDGADRLFLPDGFQYGSFSLSGQLMSDGFLVPLAHDGMAAFSMPNGNVRLIRNHEDRNDAGVGSVGGDPTKKYDPKAFGGTTSLEVEPHGTRRLMADFVSINGTTVNCAGGPTPWGSWLTCEETAVGLVQGFDKPHGYVFEVPQGATSPVLASPIKPMGRFHHEAVAVDPNTGIVYETEDNGLSGFYRFVPHVPGDLALGGKLQMLQVDGKPNYDTTTGQKVGKPLPVSWVDIDDPDPASADDNSHAVFDQGAAKGGAGFNRLEGCWYGDGVIYFNSTHGGDAGLGQAWAYRPLPDNAGGQLLLVYESPGIEVLDSPDNICVTPRGGVLLCEDGEDQQYLRGLTREGQILDFATHSHGTFEWAGACFSPDGQTLFVNIQGNTRGANPPPAGREGMTIAIWGPWEDGDL